MDASETITQDIQRNRRDDLRGARMTAEVRTARSRALIKNPRGLAWRALLVWRSWHRIFYGHRPAAIADHHGGGRSRSLGRPTSGDPLLGPWLL